MWEFEYRELCLCLFSHELASGQQYVHEQEKIYIPVPLPGGVSDYECSLTVWIEQVKLYSNCTSKKLRNCSKNKVK